MFWRRKKSDGGEPVLPTVTFEEAKEATRRAAFLNVAQGMTADEDYRRQLAEPFNVCRSAALAAGAAEGNSPQQIDAAIGALCDTDTARLKSVSDAEFQDFVRESGEIVKQFLAKV